MTFVFINTLSSYSGHVKDLLNPSNFNASWLKWGIIGRIDDMLIDGNNDKIPPTNFYSLFEKFDLKGFQILQKKDLSITVMIEGWSNINNMEQLLIKNELISRVKGQKLIIQSVNEIERSSVTNKIKIIKREK